MGVSLRRLAVLGMAAVLGLAAAPVKKITFTDTKLKNGLRVIISKTTTRRYSPLPSLTTSARATSARAAPGSLICSNT